MSNDSKVKDTINNLTSKYANSPWGDILTPIFKTEEFELAINQLLSDFVAGQPFTPTFKDLFKSLDLCTLKDVKVVIVNTYPSDEKGVANGLAFGGNINPFVNTLNEITKEKFIDGPTPSLEYLPQNGVLLLNMALTCPIGKQTDHLPMWRPVFEKLIADIAYKTLGTVFVFVGQETEYLGKCTRKGQYKFFLPAVPSVGTWEDGGVFEKINTLLKKIEKEPINW